LNRLQRGVASLRIINSGESLLRTYHEYFKLFRTTLAFNVTMKEKRVGSPTHEDEFKCLKNTGYLRLVRLLPVVVNGRESLFRYEFLSEYNSKIQKSSVFREKPKL